MVFLITSLLFTFFTGYFHGLLLLGISIPVFLFLTRKRSFRHLFYSLIFAALFSGLLYLFYGEFREALRFGILIFNGFLISYTLLRLYPPKQYERFLFGFPKNRLLSAAGLYHRFFRERGHAINSPQKFFSNFSSEFSGFTTAYFGEGFSAARVEINYPKQIGFILLSLLVNLGIYYEITQISG